MYRKEHGHLRGVAVAGLAVALLLLTANSWAQLSPFSIWQIQYFGSTHNPAAAPDADPCGKGMANTNQFLAGFDPTNCASAFQILAVVPAINSVSAAKNTSSVGREVVEPSLDLVVTYYTSGGNPYEP